MKNTILGYTLMIMALITLYFTYVTTSSIVYYSSQICEDVCNVNESACPHEDYIPPQTYLGITISTLLGALGFYLLLTSPSLRLKKQLAKLNPDEKKVFELIKKSGNAIFQSEIIKETGFSKSKVTRILDSLEAKGLIERKRRGMTNLIIAK